MYFQRLWDIVIKEDKQVPALYNSLARGERSLPPSPKDLKISLSECNFDARGALKFRDRVWIPNYEPLRTT